jgi:predicted peptidase
MKTLITLAMATSLVSASAQTSAPSEKVFSAEVKLQVGYPYLEFLPSGYDKSADEKWPLIVFLHGAGERGNDLNQIKRHGPPKVIAAGRKVDAVVICPQCPNEQVWSSHGVHALTQEIIKTHAIDTSRVYLTGLSMGGFGTWETAIDYPDTYAALLPICGGTGARFLSAARIKHIPEWIFHGAKDPVVPAAYSQRMHDLLKAKGADVRLTLYPEAQHDSWTATYDSDETWVWLMKQQRPAKK